MENTKLKPGYYPLKKRSSKIKALRIKQSIDELLEIGMQAMEAYQVVAQKNNLSVGRITTYNANAKIIIENNEHHDLLPESHPLVKNTKDDPSGSTPKHPNKNSAPDPSGAHPNIQTGRE